MKKRLLLLALASTLAFSTVAMTGCGEKAAETDSKDEKDSKDSKDDKEAGKNTLEGYLKESGQMDELMSQFDDLSEEGMDVDVEIKGNEMIMTFDLDVEAIAGRELSDDEVKTFEDAFVEGAESEMDSVAKEGFAAIEKGIDEEGAEIEGTLTITVIVNNANTGKEIWSKSYDNK